MLPIWCPAILCCWKRRPRAGRFAPRQRARAQMRRRPCCTGESVPADKPTEPGKRPRDAPRWATARQCFLRAAHWWPAGTDGLRRAWSLPPARPAQKSAHQRHARRCGNAHHAAAAANGYFCPLADGVFLIVAAAPCSLTAILSNISILPACLCRWSACTVAAIPRRAARRAHRHAGHRRAHHGAAQRRCAPTADH